MASDVTLIASSALPRVNAEAMPARVEVQRPIIGVREQQQDTSRRQSLATPGTTEPDRHTIDEAVAELRKYINNLHTSVQFSVDDDSGKLVVRIIDADNKELIRQIPPEQALVLAKFFKELDAGEAQALTLGMRGFSTGPGSLEGLLLRTKA